MDALTLPEVDILMETIRLKHADALFHDHLSAWLTQAAKSTKGSSKKPKPRYQKFKTFFDYDDYVKEARGREPEKPDRISAMREYMKKGGKSDG